MADQQAMQKVPGQELPAQDTTIVKPLFSTGDYPQGPEADNSSDSGIDSNSTLGSFRSSGPASLTSSIYDYRYANGRRYHAVRTGAEYALPNDKKEMDRLDLQHHLWRLTLGGPLHRAPIGAGVKDILDLGTGNGIWAIDMADQYPATQVVGIDLSPTEPGAIPPNCQFHVKDFEEEWTFGQGSLDFVHSRLLVAACRNWPRLLSQAFSALRPGGWIEIHESYLPIRCDDGSAAPESPLLKWGSLITEGAAKIGVNMGIIPELPHMLRDAGFEEVHVEWYTWPTNQWPKEPRLKEVGKWAHRDLTEGMQAISLGIIRKVLGWGRTSTTPL